MDIRLARPDESGQVAELVTASRLPVAGLAGVWRTWVAVDGDQLLGTASLERHGDALLLRSVAVRAGQRGRGVGAELVRAALAAGRAASVGRAADRDRGRLVSPLRLPPGRAHGPGPGPGRLGRARRRLPGHRAGVPAARRIATRRARASKRDG
jgi:GNAT superfamily N-acetyltransferase